MTEAGPGVGGAALLADRTRASRRLRPRDVAYRVYIIVLLGPAAAIALESVVLAATALLGLPLPLTDLGDLQRAAALASAGVALLTCAAVHTGAWRGPFTLDRADAAWLLGSSLPRRDLLAPRLHHAAVLGAVVGGGASAVVAVVLAQVLGSAMLAAAAVAAAAGAGLGLLVTATSWWVLLRRGRAAVVLRGTPVLGTLILAGTILALLRPSLGWVVAWSGPWGWMVQSLAAASAGLWLAALGWAGPSLVAGLAATRWMLREAGHAPAEALRLRSQHAAAVAAAMFLGELDAYAEVRREALTALTTPSGLRAPLQAQSRAVIDTAVCCTGDVYDDLIPFLGYAALRVGTSMWHGVELPLNQREDGSTIQGARPMQRPQHVVLADGVLSRPCLHPTGECLVGHAHGMRLHGHCHEALMHRSGIGCSRRLMMAAAYHVA